MRLSPHTAQASAKLALVGLAGAPKYTFTLLTDCRNCKHTGRTSSVQRRAVHCFPCLIRFGLLLRDQRPEGRGPCFHASHQGSYPSDYRTAFACSLMLRPYPQHHALRFGCPEGQGYGISTFHVIDPVSDVGGPRTPGALRFRAGTFSTCNLTSSPLTQGSGLRPHSHRGSIALTTRQVFS